VAGCGFDALALCLVTFLVCCSLEGVSKMKKVVYALTALALLSSVTACAVGKGKAPPPAPAAPIVTRG
jgi:hypothetical protein